MPPSLTILPWEPPAPHRRATAASPPAAPAPIHPPIPGPGRGPAPAASEAATGSHLSHHRASASRWHLNPPSKCFKFRGRFELAPKKPARHHLYSRLSSFLLFSSPCIRCPERSPATHSASAAKYSPDVQSQLPASCRSRRHMASSRNTARLLMRGLRNKHEGPIAPRSHLHWPQQMPEEVSQEQDQG